jgi:hypothetical protein
MSFSSLVHFLNSHRNPACAAAKKAATLQQQDFSRAAAPGILQTACLKKSLQCWSA